VNRFRRACSIFGVGALLIGAAAGWPGLTAAASPVAQSSGQTVVVPVYSHIFIGDRAAEFNLAATLSIRNVDPGRVLSVIAADYYDSAGRLLKRHLPAPVVLKPLASTEVFIPESDTSGGFGASFIVRWVSETAVVPPVVECLMIGTRSGQGISFMSQGRVVQEALAPPGKPTAPPGGN
jgi:hypothetical protein